MINFHGRLFVVNGSLLVISSGRLPLSGYQLDAGQPASDGQ